MKNKNWSAIVLLSMLVILIIYSIVQHFQLVSSYKYTVAEIVKIETTSDGGGPIIFCKYHVNDKIYNGSGVFGNKSNIYKIGRKFYIKFFVKNPNNAKLTDIPFIDTLRDIPASGWDSIPEGIVFKP